MILVEYECPHHERFEYLESHEAQDSRPCPVCEADSSYVISAPAIKPNYASVTTGKSERPAGFLSTSAIADGMSTSDYKAEISKRRKERLRSHIKERL